MDEQIKHNHAVNRMVEVLEHVDAESIVILVGIVRSKLANPESPIHRKKPKDGNADPFWDWD